MLKRLFRTVASREGYDLWKACGVELDKIARADVSVRGSIGTYLAAITKYLDQSDSPGLPARMVRGLRRQFHQRGSLVGNTPLAAEQFTRLLPQIFARVFEPLKVAEQRFDTYSHWIDLVEFFAGGQSSDRGRYEELGIKLTAGARLFIKKQALEHGVVSLPLADRRDQGGHRYMIVSYKDGEYYLSEGMHPAPKPPKSQAMGHSVPVADAPPAMSPEVGDNTDFASTLPGAMELLTAPESPKPGA
jgi:hypothetical protein